MHQRFIPNYSIPASSSHNAVPTAHPSSCSPCTFSFRLAPLCFISESTQEPNYLFAMLKLGNYLLGVVSGIYIAQNYTVRSRLCRHVLFEPLVQSISQTAHIVPSSTYTYTPRFLSPSSDPYCFFAFYFFLYTPHVGPFRSRKSRRIL